MGRREEHHARVAAVAALGKTLTRRAGSRCELCGDTLDLRVIEVPPAPDEPSEDSALLACARCRELDGSKRLARDEASLRFLETAAWSEVAPVQITAVRWLRRLAQEGVSWAQEALDALWLPDDIEARL